MFQLDALSIFMVYWIVKVSTDCFYIDSNWKQYPFIVFKDLYWEGFVENALLKTDHLRHQ